MKVDLLITYADKEIQLKFQGDPSPVGPVKLEVVDNKKVSGGIFFRINLPAMMGVAGQQPVQVILPIDFDAEAVVWVSEGPKNGEGDKLVHDLAAPHGTGRTPGGIVIPKL